MNEHNLLDQLTSLHEHNQPDADFVNRLEAEIRATHPQPQQNGWRAYRKLAALFVAGVLVTALIGLPPLRTLAEDILNFFRPRQSDVVAMYDTEPPMAPYDYRPMASLEDAEARVEFDFLVLPQESGFTLDQIYADHDAILLIYRTDQPELDDIPPIIALRQLNTPANLLPPMIVPSSNSSSEVTTVRGQAASYAVAHWSLQTPLHADGRRGTRYTWLGDAAHRLAWREGPVAYYLTAAENTVENRAALVSLAETLRPVSAN